MKNLYLKWRRSIAFSYDLCMIPMAWFLAYWIRFDLQTIPSPLFKQCLVSLPIVMTVQIAFFWRFGLYRGVWRFASIPDLLRIIKAVLAAFIILLCFFFFIPLPRIPRTIPLIYSGVLIGLLSSARILYRSYKDHRHIFSGNKRVLIVGAGSAAESLARDLLRQNDTYYLRAFVDDDRQKQGCEIHGVRVVGKIADIPKFVKKYEINLILIAIPSASSADMRRVVNLCEQLKLPFYTLPGLKHLTEGHVTINALRNVSLEDLIGRYEVNLDQRLVKLGLKQKTVLVTGGGGSIGSELCRQIISLESTVKLIVVDNSEYNLHSIEIDLRNQFPQGDFHFILLSVIDRIGIQELFKHYKPQLVFHAAAYKHVPLLEYQPRVAIYNNLIGTRIVVEESIAHQVEAFVLISTDKAVNPTNIMGATKRAAEKFAQAYRGAQISNTRLLVVRFGNVLNSAGSVVPLFRKQLEMGGPLTVTHPEATRFFMTIPEASQLILQAAFMGQGSDIFVLDMGDPVNIDYLAKQMILLSGKSVDQDIQIVYTGLRAGEKLHEEIFYAEEALQPTTHDKILRVKSEQHDFNKIRIICDEIELAYQKNDTRLLVELLKRLVPEYQAIGPHD